MVLFDKSNESKTSKTITYTNPTSTNTKNTGKKISIALTGISFIFIVAGTVLSLLIYFEILNPQEDIKSGYCPSDDCDIIPISIKGGIFKVSKLNVENINNVNSLTINSMTINNANISQLDLFSKTGITNFNKDMIITNGFVGFNQTTNLSYTDISMKLVSGKNEISFTNASINTLLSFNPNIENVKNNNLVCKITSNSNISGKSISITNVSFVNLFSDKSTVSSTIVKSLSGTNFTTKNLSLSNSLIKSINISNNIALDTLSMISTSLVNNVNIQNISCVSYTGEVIFSERFTSSDIVITSQINQINRLSVNNITYSNNFKLTDMVNTKAIVNNLNVSYLNATGLNSSFTGNVNISNAVIDTITNFTNTFVNNSIVNVNIFSSSNLSVSDKLNFYNFKLSPNYLLIEPPFNYSGFSEIEIINNTITNPVKQLNFIKFEQFRDFTFNEGNCYFILRYKHDNNVALPITYSNLIGFEYDMVFLNKLQVWTVGDDPIPKTNVCYLRFVNRAPYTIALNCTNPLCIDLTKTYKSYRYILKTDEIVEIKIMTINGNDIVNNWFQFAKLTILSQDVNDNNVLNMFLTIK